MGSVGIGQVDAHAHPRRPRPARRRIGRRRRRRPLGARRPPARRSSRRRSVGFVFQLFNLLPTLTAAENIALPSAHRRQADRPRADRRSWRSRWGWTGAAAPSGGALRRSAAARRRGAGADLASRRRLRRRAHGQPRLALEPRGARPAPPRGGRGRPDDRHGHPRRAGGRHRRSHHLPGGRPDRRRPRGPRRRRHPRDDEDVRRRRHEAHRHKRHPVAEAASGADGALDRPRRGDDLRHVRAHRPDQPRLRCDLRAGGQGYRRRRPAPRPLRRGHRWRRQPRHAVPAAVAGDPRGVRPRRCQGGRHDEPERLPGRGRDGLQARGRRTGHPVLDRRQAVRVVRARARPLPERVGRGGGRPGAGRPVAREDRPARDRRDRQRPASGHRERDREVPRPRSAAPPSCWPACPTCRPGTASAAR